MQATQAVHAALTFAVEHPHLAAAWHDSSNYLIVLGAADEAELVQLVGRARQSLLNVTEFHEEDLEDQLTGIVIEAGPVASRLCSSLPLLLREEALV